MLILGMNGIGVEELIISFLSMSVPHKWSNFGDSFMFPDELLKMASALLGSSGPDVVGEKLENLDRSILNPQLLPFFLRYEDVLVIVHEYGIFHIFHIRPFSLQIYLIFFVWVVLAILTVVFEVSNIGFIQYPAHFSQYIDYYMGFIQLKLISQNLILFRISQCQHPNIMP